MSGAEAVRLVATRAACAEALEAIERAPQLAIDTEFMRVDTYYPRFCLLQIATPDGAWCIDPLADLDLPALGAWLAATRQPKLMHAARQDLEVLGPLVTGTPQPLVDTQIAAALLGLSDQIAYAAVVEQYCGVVIDKSQTRTDWSQRPLSAEQLRYAALDVIYLPPVWEAMANELETQGKMSWLEEECARLRNGRDDAVPAWQRVKGLTQLEGRALAVAAALAEWREDLARSADRPRNWILRDDLLLLLARRQPQRIAELAELQGLPPATVRRHGERLLAICSDPALSSPALPPRAPRLTPEGNRLLAECQQLVRERAAAAKVAPTLLAARRDLEQLFWGETPPRFASGWRAIVVGEELLALRGRHRREDLCQP
ncbi:MAG TPA: ribonuclease D [Gammaproteobacteria bacterium]|nr:ribonuclease D [Gammaproteobacteria bacterium]